MEAPEPGMQIYCWLLVVEHNDSRLQLDHAGQVTLSLGPACHQPYSSCNPIAQPHIAMVWSVPHSFLPLGGRCKLMQAQRIRPVFDSRLAWGAPAAVPGLQKRWRTGGGGDDAAAQAAHRGHLPAHHPRQPALRQHLRVPPGLPPGARRPTRCGRLPGLLRRGHLRPLPVRASPLHAAASHQPQPGAAWPCVCCRIRLQLLLPPFLLRHQHQC